jgi:hypothetical protein
MCRGIHRPQRLRRPQSLSKWAPLIAGVPQIHERPAELGKVADLGTPRPVVDR